MKSAEISLVVEQLQKVKQPHYECEDCWYSCPKSGECCNDNELQECNCGADHTNKLIDEIIKFVVELGDIQAEKEKQEK